MATCQNCRKQYPDTAAHCIHCGTAQEKVPSRETKRTVLGYSPDPAELLQLTSQSNPPAPVQPPLKEEPSSPAPVQPPLKEEPSSPTATPMVRSIKWGGAFKVIDRGTNAWASGKSFGLFTGEVTEEQEPALKENILTAVNTALGALEAPMSEIVSQHARLVEAINRQLLPQLRSLGISGEVSEILISLEDRRPAMSPPSGNEMANTEDMDDMDDTALEASTSPIKILIGIGIGLTVIALAVGAYFILGGKDADPSPSPANIKQTAAPVESKSVPKPSKSAPKAAATSGEKDPLSRTFEQAGVRLEGNSTLKPILSAIKVSKKATADLAPQIRKVVQKLDQEYLISQHVFNLKRTDDHQDAWLGAPLQVTLPLTKRQRDRAHAGNTGALYLSSVDGQFIPGTYDGKAGTVTFKTEHLSGYSPAVQTLSTEISGVIKQEAMNRAIMVKNALEKKAIEALKDFLGKNLDKLDRGVKSKILLAVINQRGEIGNMASAAGSQNLTKFNENLNLMIGKAIVDNVDDGILKDMLGQVTDKAEDIAAIAKAGGSVAGGDYWKAVEILGKAYSRKFAVVTAAETAIAGMKIAWKVWKQHEWETAYRSYTKGTPRDYMGLHKAVQAGDWQQLMRSYGGITDWVVKNHKNPDGSTMSRNQASTFAKQLFDERRTREKREGKEATKMNAMWAWFKALEENRGAAVSFIDRVTAMEGKDGIQGKTCHRFLKIMQTIELELRSMGIWRDPFRGGGFQPQSEMSELFSAYAKGGPASYRNELKKIRTKQARKLNLNQKKKKKKTPPKKIKKAKGCPSCARLEQCCRQVKDSTGIKTCFAALRVFKSRCLKRECKMMYRSWRADGRCR